MRGVDGCVCSRESGEGRERGEGRGDYTMSSSVRERICSYK